MPRLKLDPIENDPRPSGCKCDIRNWISDTISPVCGAFHRKSTGSKTTCAVCEHEIECHTQA
jgi:hypothetical protein